MTHTQWLPDGDHTAVEHTIALLKLCHKPYNPRFPSTAIVYYICVYNVYSILYNI